MAVELVIHRSVKTEVGDGDGHPVIAVRPCFLPGIRWPYSGDGAQVVEVAVCRILSAHDARWNVAQAAGCKVRSVGLIS